MKTTPGQAEQRNPYFAILPMQGALFAAFAKTSSARINEFGSQGLANLIWASRQQYALVLEVLRNKVSDLARDVLCVSRFTQAFATLSHQDAELQMALSEVAYRRMQNFTPQGLANLAWAYAKLFHKDRGTLSSQIALRT